MNGLNRLLVLSILSVSLLGTAQVNAAQAGKPQGPLNLFFSTDVPPAAGATVTVTLTVTAHVASSELTIAVELPEGLPHQDGLLRWKGAVTKDQPVSLIFVVGPLETQPSEVIGRAAVTLPNGSVWTQATSILLEPGTHPPPQADEAEKPMPRLGHDRQGRSILEIPVQ